MKRIEDEEDEAELVEIRAEPWMRSMLRLNPDYTGWGPHEDYMCSKGQGWNSSVDSPSWKKFGPWNLDDLNEVVNFYFYITRDSEDCKECGASGYNPQTKLLSDSFYAHSSPSGVGWNDAITEDEVAALVLKGRLGAEGSSVPTAKEVNASQRGGPKFLLQHDAINRFILIETRAKRLGVWGNCDKCDGKGYRYTAETARLGLVLWVLHPRKGASRGVDVRNVSREDIPGVLAFLRSAAERNAMRFSKLVAL